MTKSDVFGERIQELEKLFEKGTQAKKKLRKKERFDEKE